MIGLVAFNMGIIRRKESRPEQKEPLSPSNTTSVPRDIRPVKTIQQESARIPTWASWLSSWARLSESARSLWVWNSQFRRVWLHSWKPRRICPWIPKVVMVSKPRKHSESMAVRAARRSERSFSHLPAVRPRAEGIMPTARALRMVHTATRG